MKNSIILLLMMSFSSCMVSTHVDVLYPAQIKVDPHIEKIVLAIRVHGNENRSPVFWPFSMDQAYYENDGMRMSIMGFMEQLQDNPRFKIANEIEELTGARRQLFGEPVSWIQVENLMDKHLAQALVVLEVFDVDTREYFRIKDQLTTDASGRARSIPEHEVENNIRITLGWRIYDPETMKIIDQFSHFSEERFNASGPTKRDAQYALPHAEQMVNYAAKETGKEYASRIAPFWFKARRKFYGSHEKEQGMKDAKALANIGDWNGAMQKWEILMTNASKDLLGKLSYNIALAYEIDGALTEAIYWAEQSYITHHNAKARDYFLTLKEREIQLEKVNEQLNEE